MSLQSPYLNALTTLCYVCVAFFLPGVGCCIPKLVYNYAINIKCNGISSMELKELEHPPQLWHNSKISISVTIIVTHNRKLV